MAETRRKALRCAYPGCENELRPGESEPGYCGLPDPVTGEPHAALTAFRQRQLLARQGSEVTGPWDPDRAGFTFWRRRRQTEAAAEEARSAVLQAEAELAEAVAARAAAEGEAAAAREEAESARGELDRVREAADRQVAQARRDAGRQVAQARRDAGREQAELRAGFEAQIAALEEVRAGLQARAEHAEAELQRAQADRDKAAGQDTPEQPAGAPPLTPRRRRPRAN